MHRRKLMLTVSGAFAFICTETRRGFAWTLLTTEEVSEETKAQPPKEEPALAAPVGAPVIEVLEPDSSRPIKAPVNIRIRFRAQQGATIDPATFRAKYGWLGLDITGRLIGHAKIDAAGVSADNAEIPAGHYMVTLQIADSLGRVGTRALEFTIA